MVVDYRTYKAGTLSLYKGEGTYSCGLVGGKAFGQGFSSWGWGEDCSACGSRRKERVMFWENLDDEILIPCWSLYDDDDMAYYSRECHDYEDDYEDD
jgi:hypothetical protein